MSASEEAVQAGWRDRRPDPPNARKIVTMFIAIARPAVEPFGPDAVATPGSPAIVQLSSRALHARLLDNAAARRKRAIERRRANREDDAGYWFSAAPMAVRKASELRCEDKSFLALP